MSHRVGIHDHSSWVQGNSTQKYKKKSSRAAKAHVRILARTHTAKTSILTNLTDDCEKKGTNNKKRTE